MTKLTSKVKKKCQRIKKASQHESERGLVKIKKTETADLLVR